MSEYERVFVRFRGRTIGPFNPAKIKEMIKRGQVTRMHELSGDGLSWTKADEFGNFFPHAPSMASSEMAAGASQVPPGAMGEDGAVAPAPNMNATAQWYAHVNGEKQGPVSMDQMRLYSEAKILKKDSLVWKNGMDEWKPASEAIPELFGGAPAAGGGAAPAAASPGTPMPSGGGGGGDADGGALAMEISKHHSIILTVAIALVLVGVVFFLAQVFQLNSGGKRLKSDYMNAALKMSLGGALMIVGGFALQTASKLKEVAESSSAVGALLAVRTLNQFWIAAMIATLSWLLVLVLVCIAAVASHVPVLNILA